MEFYPDPNAEKLVYVCPACHNAVQFANVEYMSKLEGATFRMEFTCYCTPGHTFKSSFAVVHSALRELLDGFRPVLPYTAAPAKAEPSYKNKDAKDIRVFTWECQQLEGVEEFLLLCSRPPAEP